MVTTLKPTAPLLHTEAITHENGTPTRYFMKQWSVQRVLNTELSGIISRLDALEADVAAIQAIDLIAGTGIAGGGDLSGPDRTFNLEDTAVTPGAYTAADITVDQQGRITAAASGSAGGGLPVGGTVGQLLRKNSATDFDASFATITASDVGAEPADATILKDVDIDISVQAWDADLDTYAGTPLTVDELSQLQQIGTTTISGTQWGYLGAFNQGLTTTSSVNFGGITSSGNLLIQKSNALVTVKATNSGGDVACLFTVAGTGAGEEVKLLFGDVADTDQSRLVWNNDTGHLDFYTGNNKRMTLLNAGQLNLLKALIVDDTTDSTSTTTGSIQTDGGAGIVKNLHVGGDTVLGGTLDLNGVEYTFPAADGTSGYSLTTNGSGTLSWTDVSGGGGGHTFSGARVKKSADQSIAVTTWVAVTWNTEDFDDGAWHDNSTNNSRMTVPTGVTRVTVSTNIRTVTTFTGNGVVSIWKNGSEHVATETFTINYSNPAVSVTSGVVDVVATDYFEVKVFFSASGNNIDDDRSNFSIHEVS